MSHPAKLQETPQKIFGRLLSLELWESNRSAFTTEPLGDEAPVPVALGEQWALPPSAVSCTPALTGQAREALAGVLGQIG